MWGRSDRVIVTSGLSKAYGLAGAAHRLGRRPPPTVAEELWAVHDYTTIGAGRAERPARADRALPGRARAAARAHARHHPRELSRPSILARQAQAAFSTCAPEAGAIAFVEIRASRSTRPRSSSACGSSRACSSSLAITSRWTATCASASARIPSISSVALERDRRADGHAGLDARRSRAHRLRQRRAPLRRAARRTRRAARRRSRSHLPRRRRAPRAAAVRVYGSEPCADAFEVIARLGASTADLRIVVETTTLDIQARRAGDLARARGDRGRLSRRDRQQGSGRVRLCRPSRRGRRAQASASCSRARSWTASRSSTWFARRSRRSTSSASKGSSTPPPTTSSRRWKRVRRSTSALARMQADGIAEADPSLDVDGWDAAAKTAALANVLMDARITPHDVARTGLDASTGDAARAAIAARHAAEAGRVGPAHAGRAARLHRRAARAAGRASAGRPRRRRQRADSRDRHARSDRDLPAGSGSLTQTAYGLLTDIVTIARGRAGHDRTARTAFTVLDFTRVLSGPYCTMQLADMGARVIKIEQPGKGDDTRALGAAVRPRRERLLPQHQPQQGEPDARPEAPRRDAGARRRCWRRPTCWSRTSGPAR